MLALSVALAALAGTAGLLLSFHLEIAAGASVALCAVGARAARAARPGWPLDPLTCAPVRGRSRGMGGGGDLRDVADELLADPAVRAGKLFGHPCLKIGGKVFACEHEGELLIKLPPERIAELKAEGARDFEPMGRKMGGWVKVPEPDDDAVAVWTRPGRRGQGVRRGRRPEHAAPRPRRHPRSPAARWARRIARHRSAPPRCSRSAP